MTRALRWLLRLVVAVLAVAVLAIGTVYWLGTRSLPDYDADFDVAGISAPLEIVRDTAGVPHILGRTEADSFFGLGFVHAQDRLWQMTMLRRTAQGRLSELFGLRTVQIDETMRRLDLYRLAQQAVAAQDPEARAALEAYAAGVNAWIAQINEGARGRGAPEFFFFAPEIAPWRPADSLAIIKLMGLQLSSHLQTEVLRARVALALPPERLADILPDDPSPGIVALPTSAELDRAAAPSPGGGGKVAGDDPEEDGRSARPRRVAGGAARRDALTSDPLSPFAPRELSGASNAWAAAPAQSASGGTLLAHDPHLGFSAPSIWYLARIDLDEGGVMGGTIPGLPLVLAGRNADVAWGLTTASADDLDVYLERLDPDDPGRYRTPEGWRRFRSEGAILRVADAPPVTLTLRWTENGPVLPPDAFDLGLVTPEGHVASVAWTVLEPQDTSFSAGLRLMRAGELDAVLAAGEAHVAPVQNLVVADGERIALQMIGRLPRRSVRHDSLGRLPAPGWRPENRWQGYLDYDDNPRVTDPESGILGNTNNKVVDRPFPLHVSFDWGDTQRVHRWARLMRERPVHSRESFVGAQLDTVSPAARTLLPLIGADLWFTGQAAPAGSLEARRRYALGLLAEWNGEMNEHLPEPLIYAAWLRELQARLIADELGVTLAGDLAKPDPAFIERVYRDVDGASAWCDVRRSSRRETCAEIARLALDDALVWIDETHGGELASLHWGDAHVATHDHQVLGDVPLLSFLVNIRQSTSGGDHTLMRGATSGAAPHPFRNVHGPGYRGVYDMADPDASLFVISTGQSGHPLSRFYDNLGEIWRRGEYIPMSLDPDLARAAAAGISTLRPAR